MRRSEALAAFAAIAAPLLVGGCARTHAAGGRGIGLVVGNGGFGDHSFNDGARRGVELAQRDLGFRSMAIASASVADYQPNMMELAGQAFDIVMTVGYDLAFDLTEVAPRFAHQRFGIVDASVDLPNVTSIGFRQEQCSFLAGALAGMVTRSNVLGFLGGIDIDIMREFEVGFHAGARAVNPDVQLLVKYVGDWNDVAGGSELAGVMYGSGADIVYACAGKAGLGAINQVRSRRDAYMIGVDSDQDGIVPGKILTSAMKRVDIGMLRICQTIAAGRRLPHAVELGLKEGGVALTDFQYTRDRVTPAMRRRLDAFTHAIIEGSITVPKTREQLAMWRA
jgi:basic membrane protein A